MMITHEKLLPCPFCGGEAELLEGAPGLYSAENHLYHAKCQSCGASAYDHGRDGAIAAWNRRTPPAAVPERLMDALKYAEKALRPFFNAVYNDNGDMTVHGGYPYYDAIAGYYAYKRVRDAISAAPAAPTGWQPIETAPKDGTWILGWSTKLTIDYKPLWVSWGKHAFGDSGWCTEYEFLGETITHWMPLPAAPTDGGNDEHH